MVYLTKELWFPNVNESSDDGLLAIGGDLSVDRLLLAYKKGIFPWYEANSPILWWSPDPRFVLFPEKLKVTKSMQQILRNKSYRVTTNTAFNDVINACASAKRKGQNGTWITNNMIEAYVELHYLGYAKSVEVWKEEQLVGGLYGVDLNNGIFCGESMFTMESNASKVGLISFIHNTDYKLIDCQVYTAHLESMGAQEIPRKLFMKYLDF